MFQARMSENKTSSEETGLIIRGHEPPRVGQYLVSGEVSVVRWHLASDANILLIPRANR